MDNFPVPNIQMTPGQGELDTAATNLQARSGIFRQQTFNSPYFGGGPTAQPGNISSFFQKAENVFKEGAHMIEGAGAWAVRQVGEGISAVAHLPFDAAKMGQNSYHVSTFGLQQNYLDAEVNQASKEYKSGYMTKAQFQADMNSLGKQNMDVSKQVDAFLVKTKSDEGQAIKDLIGTASDVITVATAGLTVPLHLIQDQGAVDLGTFLMSDAAKSMVAPAEDAIAAASRNKAVFDALPSYVQNNVKASVTDTLVNGAATMTSADFRRAATINLAVKYPLAFNWLNGTGNSVYAEMQSGKYGEAVKTLGFNAALLLGGGPVGEALAKLGARGAAGLSGKVFGEHSFIDTLSQGFFNDPTVIYNMVKDNPELAKTFQALEATNVAAAKGNVTRGAYRVIDGLKNYAVPAFEDSGLSHEQFIKTYMTDWHKAQSYLTNTLLSKGMSADEARRYVVGRWTVFDARKVSSAIGQGLAPEAKSSDALLKNYQDFKHANPNQAFANNASLDDQITNIIKTSDTVGEAQHRIQSVAAQFGESPKGLTLKDREFLGKLGYTPIIPKRLEAPFIQGDQKLTTAFGEGDIFDKAVQPAPVFQEFGALLTKVGLSPQQAAESTQDVFMRNLNGNLKETSLFKGTANESKFSDLEANKWVQGQYAKLSSYINKVNKSSSFKHPPISNVRQMTTKEISEALKISNTQAGEVQNALMQSVTDMSWEQRGVADKLTDMAGSTMQKYLRVQGAGRFAWNPVFKMKLGYKSEFLTQAETGGKAPTFLGTNTVGRILFPKYYNQLDNVDAMLRDKGLYGTGFTNEAATEENMGAGGINISNAHNGMTRSQRLSVAGLISVQAERTGMTAEQFVTNFPDEVQGTIDSLLHYNPRAGFLNSNMAKALNVAIFPFRFNLKVSTYMAKVIVRQDWVTRAAVMNGLFQAHDFLTSDQGQVWYSQNSDALGLLNYFSPMETLATVSKLGNIGEQSVGSFGELGGLPVGFITQILQSEGLWNPNTAYINAKTGQPGTDYIPQSGKAALATAISSFVGSLFTYPGSTAGLPSKTGTLNKFAEGVTGAKTADWKKVPETDLTPQQQQYSRIVQQYQASQGNQAPQPSSQPATPAPAVLPATKGGTASPIYTASQQRGKKLKKSQEPVTPLPGQTAIGQLP